MVRSHTLGQTLGWSLKMRPKIFGLPQSAGEKYVNIPIFLKNNLIVFGLTEIHGSFNFGRRAKAELEDMTFHKILQLWDCQKFLGSLFPNSKLEIGPKT